MGPGAGSRRHCYHGGFGLSHLGPEVIMDLTDHSGRGVRASVIVVVGGGGREIALPAGSWPYMPKYGDTPAVSDAWLLAASSARGSQVDQ